MAGSCFFIVSKSIWLKIGKVYEINTGHYEDEECYQGEETYITDAASRHLSVFVLAIEVVITI